MSHQFKLLMCSPRGDRWVPVDATDLVSHCVRSAGFSAYQSATEADALQAQLRQLTEIVGRLAARLPPADVIELLELSDRCEVVE